MAAPIIPNLGINKILNIKLKLAPIYKIFVDMFGLPMPFKILNPMELNVKNIAPKLKICIAGAADKYLGLNKILMITVGKYAIKIANGVTIIREYKKLSQHHNLMPFITLFP